MPDSSAGIVITVGLSLISLYIGMAAAGAQQDRDGLRKQRGIAKALWADLDRIDDELSRMKAAGLIPWTGKPPVIAPSIHPWVEGLISQIADAAPDAVAAFMRLERSLAALRDAADRAREAQLDLDEAFKSFEQIEGERHEEFRRGRYDPGTDRFVRTPMEKFEELPEHISELGAIASVDATLRSQAAALKVTLLNARKHSSETLDEYMVLPLATMSILLSLKERLYPLAQRSIPTLPQLVFKTAVPLVEDRELDELADQAAVSELRKRGWHV